MALKIRQYTSHLIRPGHMIKHRELTEKHPWVMQSTMQQEDRTRN